jgi:hypothetical protein
VEKIRANALRKKVNKKNEMRPPEFELIQRTLNKRLAPSLESMVGKQLSWPEALPLWLPFVSDSATPQLTSEKVLKTRKEK